MAESEHEQQGLPAVAEQSGDRGAERSVPAPAPGAPGASLGAALLRRKIARRLARKQDEANGIAPHAADAVAAAGSSSGTPLPDGLQRKFEGSLGADLSGVRVHTGSASAAAAESVSARAYTVGSDVHFNAGEYNPSSSEGQKLLAHEVAHTVQQSPGGGAAGAQYKLEVSAPEDASEHEADHAAEHMVAGTPVTVSGATGLGRKVMREEKPAAAAPPTPQTVLPPETMKEGMVASLGGGGIVQRVRSNADATFPMFEQWSGLDKEVGSLAGSAGVDPAQASSPELVKSVDEFKGRLATKIKSSDGPGTSVSETASMSQNTYQATWDVTKEAQQRLRLNEIAYLNAKDAFNLAATRLKLDEGAVEGKKDEAKSFQPKNIDFLKFLGGAAEALAKALGPAVMAGANLLSAAGSGLVDYLKDQGKDVGKDVAGMAFDQVMNKWDGASDDLAKQVAALEQQCTEDRRKLDGSIEHLYQAAVHAANEASQFKERAITLKAARENYFIALKGVARVGDKPAKPGAKPEEKKLDMQAALIMFLRMQDRENLSQNLEKTMELGVWTQGRHLDGICSIFRTGRREVTYDKQLFVWVKANKDEVPLLFDDIQTIGDLDAAADKFYKLLAWRGHRPEQRAQYLEWKARLGDLAGGGGPAVAVAPATAAAGGGGKG